MWIKITIKYHLIPHRLTIVKQTHTDTQTISVGEVTEKLEPLYSIGGNIEWYSYYEKYYGGSSKIKIEPPCDPAFPLLVIYLKKLKTLTQKDICTPISLQH